MPRLIIAALIALFLASPAWSVCTITGTCDMSSITDGNCAPGSGSNTCGSPAATDRFIIDGGISEEVQIVISYTLGTDTYQLQWAPPGQTAWISEPLPAEHPSQYAQLDNAEINRFVDYDWYVVSHTQGGGTTTLDIRFGKTWGNQSLPDGAASYLQCVSGTATCGAPTTTTQGSTHSDPGHLTSSGDWIMTDVAVGGVVVRGGASWTIDSDVVPEVVLSSDIGNLGLYVHAGGTVTFQGRFYSYMDSPPDPPTLKDPAGHEFTVGEVIPCPVAGTTAQSIVAEDNCASNPNAMGIRWGDAWEPSDATSDPDSYLAESLLVAAGDVAGGHVLFAAVDPSQGQAEDVPNDVNAIYEVLGIDAVTGGTAVSNAMSLYYNLYQGDYDQEFWPNSRINIVGTTIVPAVVAGDRTFAVADTALNSGFKFDGITADGGEHDAFNYARRYLRFKKDGAAQCESYAIMHIFDDAGGDIVTLLSDTGLREGFAAGTVVWIDNGMKCGDPFVLGNYVEVNSSTPLNGADPTDTFADTVVQVYGNMELVGSRWMGIPRTDFFLAGDIDLSYWSYVDIPGQYPGGYNEVHVVSTKRFHLGPVVSWHGGGPTVSPPALPPVSWSENHGLVSNNAGLIWVHDYVSRTPGDDHTGCAGDTSMAEYTELWKMERVILENLDDGGESAGGFDSVGRCGMDFDGMIISNTSDYVGVNAAISTPKAQGTCSLNEIAIISTHFTPWASSNRALVEPTRVTCRAINWFAAGSRSQTGAVGGGQFLPWDTNHFVVRDYYDNDTGGGIHPGYGDLTGSWHRNGYFKRMHTLGAFSQLSLGQAKWQNIGIFDHMVDTSFHKYNQSVAGPLDLVETLGEWEPFVADKITVAWTPGTATGSTIIMRALSPFDERGHWRNIVFANMHDACGMTYDIKGVLRWSNPTFLMEENWNVWNNDTCLGGTNYVALDQSANRSGLITALRGRGGTFRQRDPQFFDPAHGQFWPVKGSYNQVNGVGMQKGAGICKKTWPMKVLDLEPECQTDGTTGGGVVGNSEAW